jgi:hypothetical protein
MGEQEQTLESQSPAEVGNDAIPTSATEALGVVGETTQEPEQTETAEQLEHKERSKLGRRISSFEQEIDGLKQTIAQLSSNLMRPDPYSQNAVGAAVDAPPVEYISTPEDLEKYEAWRNAKQERQRNAYANNYIHSIKTMTYVNPELHSEIENELLTNVNAYPTYSNYSNPAGDAQQNYLKAENKLLKQRLVSSQTPKPNVRGGAPAPTGVSATTRMNTATKPSVKLDDYASKFIKSLGESEDADWVQKSVART